MALHIDCEYWKPKHANPKSGCGNCRHYLIDVGKCEKEQDLNRVYKTALNHEPTNNPSRRVLK